MIVYRMFIIAAVGLAVGCGKKDSDSKKSGGAIAAGNVEDLGLSSALNLEVDETISGSSTALRLLAEGDRSSEACRVRQTLKRAVESISSIGSFFCHIEKESDSIKFDQPSLVKIVGGGDGGDEESGGDQYIGIYIDSKSTKGQLTVYMYGQSEDDMELTETFTITGAGEETAKGIMFSYRDGENDSWGMSASFDSHYTDSETFSMAIKSVFSGSDSSSFRQYVNMTLVDDGVSSVQSSDAGSWQGQTFRNASAALFDSEHGNIMYSLNGEYNDQEFSHSSQACVNGAGRMVSCDDDKFQRDGDLYLRTSEVPGFLPAGFEPDEPSGFDCSGFKNEVEIDMTDSSTRRAHDSCESHQNFDEENCYDSEYQQCNEEVEIEEGNDVPEEASEDDLVVRRR